MKKIIGICLSAVAIALAEPQVIETQFVKDNGDGTALIRRLIRMDSGRTVVVAEIIKIEKPETETGTESEE